MLHNPVLLQEVIEALALKQGAVVIDGTLGSGGHAQAILQAIGATGKLVGLDQDPAALARCREVFKSDPRVTLAHKNFRCLGEVLDALGMKDVDAVLLDVGMSSEQLADEKRGFSFQTEGDLDMRMNPEIEEKASDLLARMPETALSDLFFHYGGERHSRRFARTIVSARRQQPIETVEDLLRVIDQALPEFLRFKKGKRPEWARRHPATKIFQALRIAINDELNALQEGLIVAWKYMKRGGRLAVISFHSLEDRIVKKQYQKWHAGGEGKLIFRKPIVAKREEILNNPRSRSAKLRVIEKIL